METTQQIANGLTRLLREGKFQEVYENYFEPDTVRHIEPQSPNFSNLTGLKAILEKDKQMQSNIASFNHMHVGDPAVAGDHFAIPYQMGFITKDGKEVNLNEIIVYQVEHGKIVLEQFFY